MRTAPLGLLFAISLCACSDPVAVGPDSGAAEDAAPGAGDAAPVTLADAASTFADATPATDAASSFADAAASFADAAPGRPDALPSADAGPPSAVVLNEILGDPPGTDGNNEFVEIRCTPNLSLAPFTLAIIEGDFNMGDPTERGRVTFAKALTGVSCGSGGLVVLQLRSVYDGVAGTSYADDFFTANLQNGTQTYWLVNGGPFADMDIDDDDDGVVDDPALSATIVDSVAFSDGFADDLVYSPAVLVAASGPDAASRFASSTHASTQASWYFGAVQGPSPTHYDPAEVSANFPGGGTLSPGEANTP